jgi:hypothetical protein
LATGKKPLSEAAPPAPARTQKTAQRSQVARRRAIVGGVVALLVAGGLAFALTRGGGGILPILGGGDDRETPQLAFTPRVVAATTTDTKPKKVADAIAPVGEDVTATITTLFQGAYIDPEVWDGDDYEDLFNDVMDEGSAEQALGDVDTLTLGTGAGEVYAFVEPGPNKLTVEVLTDGRDQPTQAIAKVTFHATAEHDDGTFTEITTTGSFFLRHEDGSWRIFAYDVDKQEKNRRPPSSATPTPSTEAS